MAAPLRYRVMLNRLSPGGWPLGCRAELAAGSVHRPHLHLKRKVSTEPGQPHNLAAAATCSAWFAFVRVSDRPCASWPSRATWRVTKLLGTPGLGILCKAE